MEHCITSMQDTIKLKSYSKSLSRWFGDAWIWTHDYEHKALSTEPPQLAQLTCADSVQSFDECNSVSEVIESVQAFFSCLLWWLKG